MKKAFATALLAVATAASATDAEKHDYSTIQKNHYQVNNKYDNGDKSHHHYGGKGSASPAQPKLHNINDAVGAFNTYGTLFGEHRYQLQVGKTAEMLVSTEALREAIRGIQDRVKKTALSASQIDSAIDKNDGRIEANRYQIKENRTRLSLLLGKISGIQQGYGVLQQNLAIDRAAIIMQCEQYAYAEAIPQECTPIIGGLKQPVNYDWYWPETPYTGEAPLPPFNHPMPEYNLDDLFDNIHKNLYGKSKKAQ